ncbi:MAG: crossover junction endodeoxyribonuclease RuvC [Dehalococcoidia bacterium]|nr:crossover junction endodeoxyribonuclease RuvC [Dehalococcoidia bacterium]
MRVLGVDPGLNKTGYGAISADNGGFTYLGSGAISGGENSLSLGRRLKRIYQGISEAIHLYQPETIAVEELYLRRIPVASVVSLAHARGVIVLAAEEMGLEVFHYPSSQVKTMVVGPVQATKDQVRKMVQMRLGIELPNGPMDISDALAVALCHCNMAASPLSKYGVTQSK